MLEALTIKAVSVERTVDVLGLFVKSGQVVVHNLRKKHAGGTQQVRLHLRMGMGGHFGSRPFFRLKCMLPSTDAV